MSRSVRSTLSLLSARARRYATTLLVLAGLAPRPAAADDAAEERKLAARSELSQFAAANFAARENGFFASFGADVSRCRAAVKDGTAAGLRPTDSFDTEAGPVLWKQAGATCDEYARLLPMRGAIEAVAPLYNTIVIIRGTDGEGIANMRGDAYREHVQTAKACVQAVDRQVKAGAPADVTFAPNGNEQDPRVSLADVRAQCQAFVGRGGELAAADDAAVAAAAAALRAKYTKLGATGDRLTYLMESDQRLYVMGRGCKLLDAAARVKAPVLYEMQEGDTYWVVYKMVWKKDRLVSTRERRFGKAGGSWSCR